MHRRGVTPASVRFQVCTFCTKPGFDDVQFVQTPVSKRYILYKTLLSFLCLTATPALSADLCDDLWFTRNLVFDRAGYCFGSTLGQSVFSNAGCTTKSPNLSSAANDFVAQVKNAEQVWECRIDTGRTRLNVSDISLRAGFIDLPLATGFESACIGWKGQPFSLYEARFAGSRATGQVTAGSVFMMEFEGVSGWEFYRVVDNGVTISMGWSNVPVLENSCQQIAG
jgi:hypothetical protein